MPSNKEVMSLGKEALANTQPGDVNEYFLYMVVAFLVLVIIGGLVAFWMYLKFQSNQVKPVPIPQPTQVPTPTMDSIKLDMEQSLILNQHNAQITDNAESTKRLSKAVGQLVEVTEAQGLRMLQTDAVLSQLCTIVEKQNQMISRFHGDI